MVSRSSNLFEAQPPVFWSDRWRNLAKLVDVAGPEKYSRSKITHIVT
jgi:hypothetical protein